MSQATKQQYYPLSSAQKRLFILNELSPESLVYNIPLAIKIEGNLDLNKLEKSFHTIVQRHDALQTTFEIVDGIPMQLIHENIAWKLEHKRDPQFDLKRALPNWIKPFNLVLGPLFRIELVEVAMDLYYLFLDFHHIITDARSLTILIEEFSLLYSGFPLPSLQMNYRDYALWQHELLASDLLQKQKKYWLDQLSQDLSTLNFPADYPQLAPASLKGERLYFFLDVQTTSRLRQFAKEQRLSLYMLLLTIYGTLLHRYTGETEVIIGSSIEGRSKAELRNVMGVFINALPIKLAIPSLKRFNTLLHEVKETCLEAYQNQLFPYEELTNLLVKDRSRGQNPIFQTLFDFHKGSRSKINLKELSLESIPIYPSASKLDLSLEAIENETTIELFFEYKSDLYSQQTIQRLVNGFVNIALSVIQNPACTIGSAPLFSKADQASLLSLFDHPNPKIPFHNSFQELFKKQVALYPDRIAAEDDTQQLTYAGLELVTTRLSNQLRHQGVVPGDVVATCMERSVDLLLCILAIFKAGCAYVPIDPDYPLERSQDILKESGAKIVLSNLPSPLAETFKIEWCYLQTLLSSPARALSDLDVPSEMLAYIIFTSGSTGKPKGAMLCHNGMINHIYSKIALLGLSEQDVIAQTSSQTFDVSLWQFLTGLLVGAKVVVFNRDEAWVPDLLLQALDRKRITVFETVPSHMHLILDVIDKAKHSMSSLRFLILNGEALPLKMCAKWRGDYPEIPIINAYGPTECSDDTCHYIVTGQEGGDRETPPVGSMIDNLKSYVLNSSLDLMPPNMPGEFYIGGIGLGRGYVGRGDLTAEIFIPSPFSDRGERLYRTKDLAKYFMDGNIDYLGRVDRQVKVQGVRIELEEIENVLKQHSSIQQAVVLAKKEATRSTFLVAYLILEQKEENPKNFSTELRSYLSQKLPPAMIPSHFVYLESFPLNPSGKINSKQLPEPDLYIEENRVIAPPQTDIEIAIASIWKQLLKIPHVGREDHFFEKGGNSLLAIQYASHLLSTFSVVMRLHEIFTQPILADQAASIEILLKSQAQTGKTDLGLPPLLQDFSSRNDPFPLTHVQHAYWLGRSGIFELGEVSVHVYSEYEKRGLDLKLLEVGLNRLILRHEMLRAIFPGDGTQQILKEVPYYQIPYTDLSIVSEQEMQKWIISKRELRSHEVFSADAWPLFSIEAAVLPDRKIRLFLSFDALILDGWSLNTFILEWKLLYDSKNEAHLDPLELSFRDYVLTLDKLKTTELYLRDKEYWLARIEDFPLAPPLPLVNQVKAPIEQKFTRCTETISKEYWGACQKLLKIYNLSPTGFVAAVFAEVLDKYSDEHRFTLNLTLFDRLPLHPQINDILGDFTSITLIEVNRCQQLQEPFLKRAQTLQKQLWDDLDHHLYSGIEFLREINKRHPELSPGSLMPVVLTSILGVEDNDYDVEQFLGKAIFGISQTPQVWLDYKAYEVEGSLVVEWDYVEGLFPPGFIDSMHQSYCLLLKLLATDLKTWPLSSFPLLDEGDRTRRELYNRTSSSLSRALLDELITDHSFSQHLALITSEKGISYKHLLKQTYHIAHYLSAQRVQADQLIAIVMEKGVEQVIACLGILQSGAAYLPIDPEMPLIKMEEQLRNGEVEYILTQEKWIEKIQSLSQSRKVTTIDQFSDYPSYRLPVPSRKPEDLAYVIFTSGSTGKPKGVMIEHQAVVNTLLDINDRFGVSASDRILSLSSLSFDLSVYDIFAPLLAGGATVFPDPQRIKDPAHWIELIDMFQVTIWNSVPMFMLMLVEYLENVPRAIASQLSTLRLILLSGDWIPVDLPKKIREYFGNPQLKIISLGGATEASIWSIAYEIDPQAHFIKSIPYGYPLRNQTFFVLDDQLEHTPEETRGQLYIGGVGLARGYWRDQEKTDLAFLTHPQLGRIYKTGDLGCFHATNGIEFLGRDDFQVKIGGHRVELGEIESILSQHEAVQQSVVLAIKESSYSHRLLGCVVLKKATQERALFTLAQHGRRRFVEPHRSISLSQPISEQRELWFARKSYRRFDRAALTHNDLIGWLKKSVNKDRRSMPLALALHDLILNPLSAIYEPSSPLPKYRYPSAGSLYPVQVYLSIPGGEFGGGYYYFDPIERNLVHLPSENSPSSLAIFFVAKMAAIAPLYDTLSDDFCALEAGYMAHLVEKACFEIGLSIHPVSFEGMAEAFGLDTGEKVICGFEMVEGATPNELDVQLSLYLYIKEGGVSSLSSGWYLFHFTQCTLQKVSEEGIHLTPVHLDTYSIFKESALALFFTIPSHVEKKNRSRLLLQVGALCQSLMEQGTLLQIGTCPIGQIDIPNPALFPPLQEGKEIVHTLFAGGITQAQIAEKASSQLRQVHFEDSLKEYLKEHLPAYMIPNSFVILDKLPLTANGKVDNKALLNGLPQRSLPKNERTPPRNETELRLVEVWKEILQVSELSIHDDFFALGGQSLLMTKAALKIREIFQFEIPLRTFFELTTIATLAEFLNQSISHKREQNSPQLQLDTSIQSILPHNQLIRDPEHIFLTGASGFLGSHLLHELLAKSQAKIYCLVRGDKKYLFSRLKQFQIPIEGWEDRVECIVGDLSKPCLACSPADYDRLCNRVDAIYHCGADVHHIYDFKMLKGANVDSTIELLKIATRAREKAIFYISTLAAASDRTQDGYLKEDFPVNPPQGLVSGYQQTKWASEKLLYEAHRRGIPVTLFRPCTITGHEKTGVSSFVNDHFLRLIKGCIQLKKAPLSQEKIDILPVDFVSRVISQLSRSEEAFGKVFNVSNPYKMDWLGVVEWLNQAGYEIELISPQEWRTLLAKITPDNALFPLLTIYLSEEAENLSRAEVDAQNTYASLKKLGIDFPSMGNDQFMIYFEYLRKEGFGI